MEAGIAALLIYLKIGWVRSPASSPGHYERIFRNRNTVRGGARDLSIRVVFVALLALAGGRRLRLRCVVTGNVLPVSLANN